MNATPPLPKRGWGLSSFAAVRRRLAAVNQILMTEYRSLDRDTVSALRTLIYGLSAVTETLKAEKITKQEERLIALEAKVKEILGERSLAKRLTRS